MASTRRKCICQICTCGKHICPHRKKSTLKLKEVQNGDIDTSPKSVTESVYKDSYSYAKYTESVRDGEASEAKENGRMEDLSRRSLVKTVQDKGNARSDSMESWSSKQVPKTLLTKPPDNLKSEGSLYMTTTHQKDFTEKHMEDDYILTERDAAEFGGSEDAFTKRQVPKTLPIKIPDNLKPSGALDFSTTHGDSYTDITPVEDETKLGKDVVVNGGGKIKKQRTPRPMTSLRQEGRIETETLYQKDFTPRKMEPSPKHRPASTLKSEGDFETESLYQKDFTPRKLGRSPNRRPPSNLKPEGTMHFDPTSWDYKTISLKDISPRAEEGDFSYLKRPRPESQIKIPPVPLVANTTASDFKVWDVGKPFRWKPKDSLKQIGEMESIDDQEMLEQIKKASYKEDLKMWNVSRPVIRKPASNLKPEGEINFETTHNADYIHKQERRETEDYYETTEKESERRESPEDDASGGVHDETARTEQTEDDAAAKDDFKTESPQEETETPKPMTPSEQQEEREVQFSEDIQSAQEIYSDESQYLTWDQVRPVPIRPQSNLRQDGDMVFSTTNRSEFINRPLERVKGFRPKTTTKISGDIETTTTNQVMFAPVNGERVNPIRPKSNLHVENGIFNGETTSNREFQPWHVEKPMLIKHKSTLTQEGDMEFTTTHHKEFEPKDAEKVSPIRPKTNDKVYDVNGVFDGMTTNRAMHQKFTSEKVESVRHENNLKPSSGIFSNETTNRKEFQQWGFDKLPAVRPNTNIKQEGEMDFTTTNQTQFQAKTAEHIDAFRPHTSTKISGEFDGTTVNQVTYKSLPTEKAKMFTPQTNLHVESGQFEGNTTNKIEFKQWNQVKSTPITPRDNLTQEGNIDFTTTNRTQFNEKSVERVQGYKPKPSPRTVGEFDGTTTNQVAYKYAAGSKVEQIKPQGNLQVENGDFSTETTTKSEYKEWEIDRQKPFRPKSTVRNEGELDFTTTNRSQFHEKSIDRVSEIRPITNTKISGDFDGTTTNRVTYKGVVPEKQNEVRPRTNLRVEDGKFSQETTVRTEYQPWEYAKQTPVKPQGNLKQEGEMDFTTSNQREYTEKTVDRVHAIRPHSTEKINGDFDGNTTSRTSYQTPHYSRAQATRHEDNIRKASGSFDNETTTKREFVYRQSDRPEPVRPKPNLHQEGGFDFTTSNQLEFGEKSTERPTLIRPKTMTKPAEGEFYGTTTNRSMFQAPKVETVHQIRPHTNLRVEKCEFNGNTTAREEFKAWNAERPAPVVYSDTLKHEGTMQFETTNRREFSPKTTEQPVAIRPKTTTKIEGDLDVTTTNQVMFANHVAERVQPIRQKDNLSVESGKFSDETTSKREYRQWVGAAPRGRDAKNIHPLKAAGIRTQFPREQAKQEKHVQKSEELSKSSKDSEQVEVSGRATGTMLAETKQEVKEISASGAIKQAEKHTDSEMLATSPAKHEVRSPKFVSPTESITTKEVTLGSKDDASITSKEKIKTSKISGDTCEPWKLEKKEWHSADEEVAPKDKRFELHSNRAALKIPKRFKPVDNLKLENVPFESSTTTRTEFRKWEASKSTPKKRSPALKQEGDMRFTTTAEDYSKAELHESEIRKAATRSRKPQDNLRQSGVMEFSSTNQSSYVGNITPKTKNLRPKSTLKLGTESKSFETRTTTTEQQNLMTTTNASYKGYAGERSRAYRPTTSQKVGEGAFEGKSTTQVAFTVPTQKIEKTKSFKPDSSHALKLGDEFQGSTTYRCSFDAIKSNRHCPVLDLNANGGYKFKEEVNGHLFYLPLVHS